MKCQTTECPKRASLYVKAWGTRSWSGVHCPKHAGRVIRIRARLIKKYNQSVVVRPVTKRDIKMRKKGK